MSGTTKPLAAGAGILLGLLLASPLNAQEERRPAGRDRADNGVFRMEILNGPTPTVRYFGPTLSVVERSTLREAEQAENEATLARDLLALKQQYVTSERLLEPLRRRVQQSLYGVETTATEFDASSTLGYGGGVYALPYVYPNPWLPATGAVTGGQVTVSRSLAAGVGNEGIMKEAIARVLGMQSTPDSLAEMQQARSRVVSRAASSPALREVLGVRPRGEGVRPAAGEITEPDGVTLTLKSGEKLRGTKIEEGKEWIIVHTAGGRQVKVREAEVMRIDLPAKAPGGK